MNQAITRLKNDVLQSKEQFIIAYKDRVAKELYNSTFEKLDEGQKIFLTSEAEGTWKRERRVCFYCVEILYENDEFCPNCNRQVAK